MVPPAKTKTTVMEMPIAVNLSGADKAERVKVRLHKRIHWWLKSLSRKQFIAFLVALIAVCGGITYGVFKFRQPAVTSNGYVGSPKKVEPPKPTTVASRMTGVQIAPELNSLPVTGVMIENSQDARPQSGLLQADLVYEAIAEGGITRFLALFQESKPSYIGPVRSARPYYLDFLVPYDGALAHAGGSAQALSEIKSQGIKDLEYGVNASTYDRVKNRAAPHNLYTSRDRLLELQNRKGFATSTYHGLARKDKDTPSAAPTARSIDFTISSSLYNPHYDYDATTNTYKRSEGGKPHVDERSGTQLSPKVVIALVVGHSYAGIYSVYQLSSGGTAYIFQDGVVTTASWTKTSRAAQLTLKDASGNDVALNPGQTWISLVSATSKVTYSP